MVELTEQQAIAKIQMNENQLNQINQKINNISRAMEEINMTIRTLRDLPPNVEDGLLPLGGVFIPMKTTDGKIPVNIGSGVVSEQNREQAIETLTTRDKSLREMMRQLKQTGLKINKESNTIKQKLNERHQQPDVPVISG